MPRSIAALLAVVLVAGCAGGESQRQPTSNDEGIQVTGRFDGAALSLSDGAPDVVRGDCDPGDGVDDDLCVIGVSLDGAQVAVVFENPVLLTEIGTIDVVTEACEGCDDVDRGLVVDVRADQRSARAAGGSVTLDNAGPVRLAGEFRLRFNDGSTLTGSFDVGLPVRR